MWTGVQPRGVIYYILLNYGKKINTFDNSPFMEPLSTYRTHNSYRNPFNGHSELFLCVQVNPVLVSLAKWIVTWLLSFFFSFFPRGS